MHPLHVLRLPCLPIAEILKCMNPIELFTLAQCSQKAARIIPLSNSKNFKIDCLGQIIMINMKYTFDAKLFARPNHLAYPCRDIDCRIVRTGENNVTSYWSNTLIGIEQLCFYLANLFKCPINGIAFDPRWVEWFIHFVHQISKIQKEIKQVSISNAHYLDLSSNNLRKVLDSLKNFRITEKLFICCETEENFTYQFSDLPKCFIVHESKWVSLPNLLSVHNCEMVQLHQSLIDNKELGKFMALWNSGRYSNLKYLEIRSTNLTSRKTIAGLNRFKDPLNKAVKCKRICDNLVHITKGVEISRNNGQKAEIRMSRHNASVQFQMFVHEESDTIQQLVGVDYDIENYDF